MQPVEPTPGARREADAESSRGTFRIFGVPVRLHFTFVLFLTFIIVMGASGEQSGVANAVYIVSLFVSVLLHELGHVGASRRYGIKTIDITMYPIGGVARLERMPKPKEELWIALAGPLVNVLIFAAIYAYLVGTNVVMEPTDLSRPTDRNILARIAMGNLVLAAFNMIPAFPMDGGRVLRSLLARAMPEESATRKAAAAGRVLAILFGLYGLISGNFLLVFIAFFVYLGAAQESYAVTGRVMTQGVPVRAAMVTDFRTLAHGDTLRDAANLLLATSQQDFPVMVGEQVAGVLGRNALVRGIAESGAEAYVAGIMDREFERLSPEMDLAEAMPILARSGGLALVMEGERLLGMITRENLSEYVMLRRFGLETPSSAA